MILGGAIISINQKVLYSSLPEPILTRVIKENEFITKEIFKKFLDKIDNISPT